MPCTGALKRTATRQSLPPLAMEIALIWPLDCLPFGGGPRTRPVQQMALAQAHFISLLQTLKGIETRKPVFEGPEEYKSSTESKNGAKVVLIPP
jgi:hypothetical protein